MKVFVAGATGAVGRPLVARLLEAGHDVVGTTRRKDRAADLRAQGAEPVVVEALDADALATAVRRARPEVIVQQLTALPQAGTAEASDHAATSRLRLEGTRALLRGAPDARMIAQSVAFFTRPDGRPVHDVGEGYPIAVPGRRGPQRSRWSSKGMPRRRAAEKRFLIAVQGAKVWGTLEYRVAERSLFLGSLLTEPWAQERLLPARALYAEARVLAREAGLWEVRAAANSWDDYPCEVRYQRQGRVWRVDP